MRRIAYFVSMCLSVSATLFACGPHGSVLPPGATRSLDNCMPSEYSVVSGKQAAHAPGGNEGWCGAVDAESYMEIETWAYDDTGATHVVGISSLVPSEIGASIVDGIGFDKWVDLVGMRAMTMTRPRAHEISARYTEQGALAVLDGMHLTAMPAEAPKLGQSPGTTRAQRCDTEREIQIPGPARPESYMQGG